jgi:D-alanyl-lipoteichoic acid acyltransferase DltB (MBOAT superfamily)
MENLSALPQATDRDENVLSGRIRLDGLLSNWKEALPFLAIALQLALLIWICRRFHLEHEAFAGSFLTLTAIGFVIHHCLPQSQRLNFLALLSLATYMTVLGVRDGLSLIVISVTFIVVARLPVRLPIRVTILMGMALFLTYLRSNHIMVPWSDAIWPILWSMLLFRLIIYLFDLRHGKVPTTWQHAMAYFFLLPNVVFPLFPPIDYAAFWRSYYQGDPCRTYQQGIRWMFVGVLHLLVYRYIDYYWIESPEVIISSKSLIQYVIASYLLIIRLSGQFHLIVGILHLFGFGLPRCMDHYFLATGFTDYWRRVNIYWKDFIQKVVYYPAHFRLKSFSNTTKLVIATLCGFLLHGSSTQRNGLAFVDLGCYRGRMCFSGAAWPCSCWQPHFTNRDMEGKGRSFESERHYPRFFSLV